VGTKWTVWVRPDQDEPLTCQITYGTFLRACRCAEELVRRFDWWEALVRDDEGNTVHHVGR
jgi:hypothetical protein